MQFYRLVKPVWAQPTLANGEPNPKFVEAIDGPNTYEGCDFTPEFLAEKNSKGYNLYFFPNHPSRDVYAEGVKHLSGRHIDVFNFLFVDMDLKDEVYPSKEAFIERLRAFPLKPTMVVDSGNGVHAYWRISDLQRSQYVIAQLALLTHFNTDESIWTVLQLMRVPMYFNTKRYKDYVQTQIIEAESSGTTYSIQDFPKDLFNVDEKLVLKAQNHINRLEGKSEIDLGQDVNIDEIPDAFMDLMIRNSEIARLFHDPKSHGDRSSADMKLANLLFNNKFDIRQALAVMSNTQKALERGAHRMEYAALTVSKVYADRPKHKFQTVSEYLVHNRDKVLEPQIWGPHYLDFGVLGDPWRRKEILGLIAGSGVGKTAVALNIVREIIQNNPSNDDVYVFFSLEMSKGQIIKRWLALVGENSPLADRLYVVDTQDEKGMPLIIGLQEIHEICMEIKQVTGKHIGAILIDHFHLISSHIDTRKRPNFGISSEQGTGWGDRQNLSTNLMATQLKALVKMLDTFMIVLAQTTKEKGVGDLPIGKDGAYGISQFEWIMDYIVTIWQPLMRVQNLCTTNFLSYQFAKIREKHVKDTIKEYEPKLLTYEMGSGNLRPTTSDEYSEFLNLLPKAQEIRDSIQKKKPTTYSIPNFDSASIDRALQSLRLVK
jgi:phosphohistidine swiveling domain-containing protein